MIQAARPQLPLDRRKLVAVLSPVCVVAALELSFKLQRIGRATFDAPLGLLTRAALLGSELAFALGLGLCALATAHLLGRRGGRWWLVPLCLACAVSAICSCVAHGYFLATGGTLDWALVQFALARPRDTLPIILSATAPALGCALIATPLACLIGPFIALRRRSELAADGGRPVRAAGYALGALGCIVLAGQLSIPGVPRAFVREPTLSLLSGYARLQRTAAARPALTHVPARPHGATTLTRAVARPEYNVVFIVLESARADSVSPYHPGLDNTPALARLARASSLVERAYSVVPHTSKSLVATLCGYEPRTSAELVENQPDGLPGNCLPQLLRARGYDSVFFQAPRKRFENYAQLVQNLGFARFIPGDDMPHRGFEDVNYFGYEDAVMLEPSRRWLEQAHEPFVAVYLTSTSHHPYKTPKSWPRRSYAQQRDYDAYLNALGYVDSVMGQLLEQYERAGLTQRTLFVVLGDHGEGFGEHGMWTHDNVLYEEGIRIPLLFRLPEGVSGPARIVGPVNQLAIVPSVLSVLGLAAEPNSYAALSVFDNQAMHQPLHLACFRNAHCLATVSERYKLIYHYQDRPPQLFDLQSDPSERRNLASEQPERVTQSIDALLAWEAGVDKLHAQSSERALEHYVQRTPHTSMQHTASVQFGPYVQLVGYDVQSPRPDGAHVTCYLRVEQALPDGYHFVLHLSSGFWHTRSLDEQPVRGLYPYRRWRPGDYIANFYRSDWPVSWERLDTCLELQDARGHAVSARDARDGRALADCVPLASLDQHDRERAKK